MDGTPSIRTSIQLEAIAIRQDEFRYVRCLNTSLVDRTILDSIDEGPNKHCSVKIRATGAHHKILNLPGFAIPNQSTNVFGVLEAMSDFVGLLVEPFCCISSLATKVVPDIWIQNVGDISGHVTRLN